MKLNGYVIYDFAKEEIIKFFYDKDIANEYFNSMEDNSNCILVESDVEYFIKERNR